MLRLAWKSVKHKPGRLLLSGLAVVLGVSFVASIHVFTNSIDKTFTDLFGEIYAGDSISVASTSASFDGATLSGFDESVVDDIAAVEGVDKVYPGIDSAGVILNPDGSVPTVTGAPDLVFSWIDDPDASRVTLVDGRAPSGPNEVVVDVDTLESQKYAVGDGLLLANGDGVTRYTIVGSIRFGDSNALAGASLVIMSLEGAQAFSHHEGEYTSATVTVADGYDVKAVADAIQAVVPEGVRSVSNQQLAEENIASLRSALSGVDTFTLVFALISIFVGAFIIVNTFRIIVTQRTREIGLQRALGATPSQIRGQVLLEAVIVGVGASAVGILAGYAFAAIMIFGISQSPFGTSFSTPTLPLDAIVWGFAVGIAVTLVSAMLPAIHASGIKPMEALREAGGQSRRPLGLRNIVGSSITAVGLGLIMIGLWVDVSQPAIWVGAGAAAGVIGVALLTAQALVPLSTRARLALGSGIRLPGKLALTNIAREPRRSGITASALMIGVLMLALGATFTETAKAGIQNIFAGQATADFWVAGSSQTVFADISPTAQAIIAETDGVALTSSVGIAVVTVDDDDASLAVLDLATAEDTWRWDAEPSVSHIGDGVYIGTRLQAKGYEVGDTITVTGTGAPETLRITGLYNLDGDADLVVGWDTGRELVPDFQVAMTLVNIDDGADPAAVKERIETRLAAFPLLGVTEPSEVTKQINQAVDGVLVVLSALLGVSLVIAVLGVANTLLLSITERTREIGLLRAVGVTRRGVRSMVTIESVLIAVFGALLGAALGVGFAVLIINALNSDFFGTPVVPWLWLGVYTALATVAGIIAALWPAIKASRINILEAIAIGE